MNEYLINKITCCDCLDSLPKLDNESIDLIVTDIPYGIDYKSNRQSVNGRYENEIKLNRQDYFKKIKGDKEIPLLWLEEAYRILKDNAAMYIFVHWSTWHLLYHTTKEIGFKIKNMIVLNKSNHGMGDLKGSYAPKHELILFATKGRHMLSFPEKRMKDVWDVPIRYSGSRRFHPNEKPESWIMPCIENSSQENDIVLDPFAGSGTVGVVCKKLNRNYIMFDIDKEYCETAKKRII